MPRVCREFLNDDAGSQNIAVDEDGDVFFSGIYDDDKTVFVPKKTFDDFLARRAEMEALATEKPKTTARRR